MAGELVPELHDIGKLCDVETLSQDIPVFKSASHWFKDIDLASIGLPKPETLTWLGVIGHHRLIPGSMLGSPAKELQADSFENIASLAKLQLGDHFASSTTRALEEEKGIHKTGWRAFNTDTVQTIWRSEVARSSSLPVKNKEDLRKLLEYLQTEPDYANFATRSVYGNLLVEIPEEKGFPRNITSLKVHLELTGKAYRIFQQSTGINPSAKSLTYQGNEAKSVREAEQKWTFRLVRCKITFPQHPSRFHDLGVFLSLQDLMQKIESEDHVLMHTLDSLWFFLPVEEVSPLNGVLKPFLDAGFIIQADVAEKPLGDIDSRVFDRPGENIDHIYLYPHMPDDFPPHICELCQMRRASSETVIDEESGITEHLCQVCKGFRKLSKDKGKFIKLGGEWEELGITIAWVKVSLDYERLPKILTDLFKTYLREKTIPEEEIEALAGNLRDTALMVDFTSDYRKLLSAFSSRIRTEMDVEDIGGDHPELLVVALKEKGQALQIADAFIEEFRRLFPKCENDSPISLSISVSNVKYPFFEHWQFLDKPGETLNIQAVNRAWLALSLPKFRKLRGLKPEKGEKASSKLHRAVAVGARTGSELMAKIEFLEDLQCYPDLHKAHIEHGFPINELINYHKIADIGGES